MRTSAIITAIACGFIAQFAHAAPLDPAEVPADAKWVLHVDYDALAKTEFMQGVRDHWPAAAMQARQMLQMAYGVDPQEDLHGFTMFSDSYEAHSGAVIIRADFDRAKLESDMMSKPGVKTTRSGDSTIYTFPKTHTKAKHAIASPAEDIHANPQTDAGHDDAHMLAERMITAMIFDDSTMVLSPTIDQTEAVAKMLSGRAESLKGKESKLVAEAPAGAFFYGAAIDLQQIAEHEQMFPILEKHDFAMWSLGEKDGQMFEEFVAVAKSEAIATEMKSVFEGMVSLGRIWTADSKKLASLYENVSVEQQGNAVHFRWRGSSADVVESLDELKTLAMRWTHPHAMSGAKTHTHSASPSENVPQSTRPLEK